MSPKHLRNIQELLDGTLSFTWTDDEHLMVFFLCNYLRLNEEYILPMFKASLKLEYAFNYARYRYFYFVYLLHDTNFHALSTFFADWLALHFPLAGLNNAQLAIITLSDSYGFFCHIVQRRRCMYLRGEETPPPVRLLYTPSELAVYPSFLGSMIILFSFFNVLFVTRRRPLKRGQ